MKYCPDCGSEYVEGIERCPDCDVALVEDAPDPASFERLHPVAINRAVVFTSGRRIDAEMVRSLLEAHGFDATVWGSGMGAYRLESALTEVTGVPNAFNAFNVAVVPQEEEDARALLADVDAVEVEHEASDQHRTSSLLGAMRPRWALIAGALFLLILVIAFGPPGLG